MGLPDNVPADKLDQLSNVYSIISFLPLKRTYRHSSTNNFTSVVNQALQLQ